MAAFSKIFYQLNIITSPAIISKMDAIAFYFQYLRFKKVYKKGI